MSSRTLVRVRALWLIGCWAAGAVLVAGQAAPRPLTQAELFQPTKIWTAHLTFRPDQWNSMEPRRTSTGLLSSLFRGDERLQGNPGERNGYGAVQKGEFPFVHADLEFAGYQFHDVAVRYKGNGTYLDARGSGKLPYKIDLNKYVKGQKLAGVSTLNFHNQITDRGFMNEALSYRLYRDAGVPAARLSYVRLYVTVTGEFTRKYLGLYTNVENTDENFFQARFGSGAGAIIKPVSVNPFRDLGSDWARYVQTYDPKTDLTDAEKRRIIEFCQFVSRASDADFAARIGGFVDLEEFARYFAVLAWINNIDSLLESGQNFYMHLGPTSHTFIFVPWDQDHSFGGFAQVRNRAYETGSVYKPWSDNIRFLARMYAVPSFRAMYLSRMREFSGTIFKPERFMAQVAELAPVLRPAVMEEPARLARFEAVVAGRSGLLPFVAARAQSVVAQLAKER